MREEEREGKEGEIETESVRGRNKQTDDIVGKQTPFICMQQPMQP